MTQTYIGRQSPNCTVRKPHAICYADSQNIREDLRPAVCLESAREMARHNARARGERILAASQRRIGTALDYPANAASNVIVTMRSAMVPRLKPSAR